MSGSPFVSLQPYNKAGQDTSMDDIWRSMIFDISQGRTLLTPERFSVFRSMKDTKNDTGLYA
tara:strand:- start:144 stop:329 length:186 start_codon:yes stop_codon:yes gene_type:complete